MKISSNLPDRRKVILVEHVSWWPSLAKQEIERIRAALPGQIVAIHHVGSTAIPGIKAKPILDFVMGVRSLSAFDQETAILDGLGYSARGEHGISGRRYFTKDTNGSRSHHLHVYQYENPEIERHLLFRDFLRQHPEHAREYERLKEKLAMQFPHDSWSYAEAKSDFIRSIDEMAKRWKG